MPDVLCPVCGMPNSSDEEFCSFCFAVLKPTQLDSKSEASKEDLRDWLQSLRSSAESDKEGTSQGESLPGRSGDRPEPPIEIASDENVEGEDRTISSSREPVEKGRETPFMMRELLSDMKFSDELESEEPGENEFNGEAGHWLSRLDESKDEQIDQFPEKPDLEENHPYIEQPASAELSPQEGENEASLEKEPPYGLAERPIALKETELSDQSLGETAESIKEVEQAPGIETPTTESIVEELEDELHLETSIQDYTHLEKATSEKPEKGALDFKVDTGISSEEDKAFSLTLNEEDLTDLGTIPEEDIALRPPEAASKYEVFEAPDEEGIDTDLVPAELPSWLQSMRPVEAANISTEVPTKTELEKQEVAGPLAGLRGALPAEPDISQARKPSAYSIRLQVNEIQQSQATLLEEMVQSETEARPVPVRPVITSQHVLRIIFSSILILSALVPIATGIPQVGLPADVPGISRSIQLIGSLSTGVPVLLAIDYAPGFSGEMDTVAALVVDHLMRQGVYLTLISTIPTGPTQGERLIASVSREGNHGYSDSNHYINLGLISGGLAGLRHFSEAPSLVSPREILGKPAWNDQPLNGVRDISKFSMVIVATENPETARSWVEQVQPVLKGVPLILVVSSQAEPILRPYYEAIPQQVQGLIGGLMGGVLYQSQNGKNGRAGFYWPSFSISMMLAGFLIVTGGLVNLTFAYTERRKERNRNVR